MFSPSRNVSLFTMKGTPSSGALTTPIPNQGYICTTCFKVFQTGQALAYHQTSHHHHLLARPLRPNIFGEVLNRPLLSDDVHSLASALARGANNSRNHLLPPPPPPPSPLRRGGESSSRARGGGSLHHCHHSPYHQRRTSIADKANKRRCATKNLIGQLKTITQDHEIRSSPGGSLSNPIIIDDGVDLQLSLKSREEECVNLELKLGF